MSPNSWFSQPVYIPGGNPETMNEATLLYPGQLGIRFSYRNPSRTVTPSSDAVEDGTPKTFKLVKTDSTMSVAPYDGAVAWYANQANYLVTTTVTTLGRGRVAGVFKTAVTPGNHCCIQLKGKSLVKFVDGVVSQPDATGKLAIPSATNGKADCLAAGSAATYPILGRTVSAYDAPNATAIVDLDVPEVL
jgi:hypothetical protein